MELGADCRESDGDGQGGGNSGGIDRGVFNRLQPDLTGLRRHTVVGDLKLPAWLTVAQVPHLIWVTTLSPTEARHGG